MPQVTVTCDRCGQTVQGLQTDTGTSGFYCVDPASMWNKYANPGEKIICDSCMWSDPRYQAGYGRLLNALFTDKDTPPKERAAEE